MATDLRSASISKAISDGDFESAHALITQLSTELKALLPSLSPQEGQVALETALNELESALTAAKLFRAHLAFRLNALLAKCAYDESTAHNHWNVSG